MQTVGIRELKAKLSKYLRYARKGEVVLVTDRGRVVAEIRFPRGGGGCPSSHPGLQELIDRGIVSEGGPNDPSLYPPAPAHLPPGTAKRLLDEERGDSSIVYVESSAVLAWLLDQPGGKEARRVIRGAEILACSALTLFECDRSIRRGAASGLLDEATTDRCHSVLASASARWKVTVMEEEVLSRGRRPFPKEPLRSLDAIHLATALYLRPGLPDLRVLTLDERIAANARLLGFPVEPAPAR